MGTESRFEACPHGWITGDGCVECNPEPGASSVLAKFRCCIELVTQHTRTIAVNPAEHEQVKACADQLRGHGPIQVVPSPYVPKGSVYMFQTPAEILSRATVNFQ